MSGTSICRARVEANDKAREGRLDLAGTTCIQNHSARTENTCHILYDPPFSRGLRDVGRVDEHCNRGGWGYQAVHQLKALCDQLHIEDRNACDVAAWPIETSDETKFDRVGTDQKDYRDCLGRCLSSQRSWCASPLQR